MEKYYTPEIEEFNVGFEFEFEVRGFNSGWTKDIIFARFNNGWECNLDNTLAMFEDGCFGYRVKYLDSEDIESLGFHTDKERHWEYRELYKSGNYSIEITLPSRKMIIRTIDDEKDPDHFHGYEIPKLKTIFEGYIKNKSELVKLLKQLCITK